ncbi:hypothetical protein E4U43_008212 [Claviceps pusilla]|uniref:Uncharacterized protein n=1 Tax=Claviceps pusilla TaxID=123648 RepID=A0A9P7SZV6_9HYPO|nr:hypothetical protein E4U43_008212 [Claviceps pusilla]
MPSTKQAAIEHGFIGSVSHPRMQIHIRNPHLPAPESHSIIHVAVPVLRPDAGPSGEKACGGLWFPTVLLNLEAKKLLPSQGDRKWQIAPYDHGAGFDRHYHHYESLFRPSPAHVGPRGLPLHQLIRGCRSIIIKATIGSGPALSGTPPTQESKVVEECDKRQIETLGELASSLECRCRS